MAQATRIDLHTHTFFSDGELSPNELIRRAATFGYAAIGISDHGDASNLEDIFARLNRMLVEQAGQFPLTVIPSVELTHVPPSGIARLARRAKELGAGLVVVHGETIVEPVEPGTNRAAVECKDVDILAHPGFVTADEAAIAKANGVHLEITSRKGHSLTNGYVAKVARVAGAKLVVDTDSHAPQDLIDQSMACAVARGAGLDEAEIEAATVMNPRALVERAQRRLGRLV